MRPHRTLFALYLLFFGEVFRVESAGRIQDSEDHDADIGKDGQPHRRQSKGSQDQDRNLDGDGEDHILLGDRKRMAGDADHQGDLRRPVVHQHHVRGIDGGVTAHRAHGDSDIGPCEHRRVVDAITDEGQGAALPLRREEFLDPVDFAGR